MREPQPGGWVLPASEIETVPQRGCAEPASCNRAVRAALGAAPVAQRKPMRLFELLPSAGPERAAGFCRHWFSKAPPPFRSGLGALFPLMLPMLLLLQPVSWF